MAGRPCLPSIRHSRQHIINSDGPADVLQAETIKLSCFTKEQRALHATAFKAYEGGVILDSMGAWRNGVPRPTSAALTHLRNTWATLFPHGCTAGMYCAFL